MKKITLLFLALTGMLNVANAQTTLYSENFSSNLGWTGDTEVTFTPSTLNGTWAGGVNLTTAGDLTNSLRLRYGWSSTKLSLKKTDVAVTIPNINVAGYTNLNLSIDMVTPGASSPPFIEASVDGGVSWVTLTTVTGGSWGVQTQSIVLPAATSTMSLRINPPVGDDHVFDNFVITGTASLGIGSNELTDNSIKVYQNPFNDNVEVECAEIIKNISIYSISGQIVDKVTANSTKVNIATGNLSNGVYMLKIETENGAKTVKFIK